MNAIRRYPRTAAWLAACGAAAVVLSGCSSGQQTYDEAKHRAAIEKILGQPVADWPRFVADERVQCTASDSEYHAFIEELAIHATTADFDVRKLERVNVQYLCPQQLKRFDDVAGTVTW